MADCSDGTPPPLDKPKRRKQCPAEKSREALKAEGRRRKDAGMALAAKIKCIRIKRGVLCNAGSVAAIARRDRND